MCEKIDGPPIYKRIPSGRENSAGSIEIEGRWDNKEDGSVVSLELRGRAGGLGVGPMPLCCPRSTLSQIYLGEKISMVKPRGWEGRITTLDFSTPSAESAEEFAAGRVSARDRNAAAFYGGGWRGPGRLPEVRIFPRQS